MFVYCGNNAVNRIDPTGEFWNGIWEFVKEAADQIGQVFKATAPVYAGMGAATLIDGPLPFADVAMLAGAVVLSAGVIGYGIFQATKNPSIPKGKTNNKSETIPLDNQNKREPVRFPADPLSFKPNGLVMVIRPGTKNGRMISWMSGRIEVFRWDENRNYVNGPHYHINGLPGAHFYPGNVVPQPYSTIYFGR